jgi:hypothetical protein
MGNLGFSVGVMQLLFSLSDYNSDSLNDGRRGHAVTHAYNLEKKAMSADKVACQATTWLLNFCKRVKILPRPD